MRILASFDRRWFALGAVFSLFSLFAFKSGDWAWLTYLNFLMFLLFLVPARSDRTVSAVTGGRGPAT